MRQFKIVVLFLVLYVPAGLALVGVGSTLAMPGWSQKHHPDLSMSEQRRDQIQRLHSAYEAALSDLDWSIDEDGHPTETMRQARQLHNALQAEIRNVIRRTSGFRHAERDTCPFSGESMPTRSKDEGETFRL